MTHIAKLPIFLSLALAAGCGGGLDDGQALASRAASGPAGNGTMEMDRVPRVQLRLVSARDHVEGSFLGSHALYADRDRLYAGAFDGRVFVLGRDRATNFPLLQTVEGRGAAVSGVRGDDRYLYVAADDGTLSVYDKQRPLRLLTTVSVSRYSLSSVEDAPQSLFAMDGQGVVAADSGHLYLSALNEGNVAVEINKGSWTPGEHYGQSFEPSATVVYDLRSGRRVTAISNPRPGAVAMFTDGAILALTSPGCCGDGIALYDAQTLQAQRFIARRWTNTVARAGRYLIAGNECGNIDVFDLGQRAAPMVATLDLRQVTGHTGGEDIEIRALWSDGLDGLIFAASSWGNDQSRSPSLPSVFALELRTY